MIFLMYNKNNQTVKFGEKWTHLILRSIYQDVGVFIWIHMYFPKVGVFVYLALKEGLGWVTCIRDSSFMFSPLQKLGSR